MQSTSAFCLIVVQMAPHTSRRERQLQNALVIACMTNLLGSVHVYILVSLHTIANIQDYFIGIRSTIDA